MNKLGNIWIKYIFVNILGVYILLKFHVVNTLYVRTYNVNSLQSIVKPDMLSFSTKRDFSMTSIKYNMFQSLKI